MTVSPVKTFHRAQTIGSLVRPDWLMKARLELANGDLTVREFKKIEDRAVDECIRIQEEAGLTLINDGELRRDSYMDGPMVKLGGYSFVEGGEGQEWYHLDGTAEVVGAGGTVAVVSPLTRIGSMFAEECTYLRSHTDSEIKCTIVSPMSAMFAWNSELSKDAYPTPIALMEHLAELLRDDIKELNALGCNYIQIDAPEFTFAVDDRRRKEWSDRGVDPDELVAESIRIINGMFEGLDTCQVSMHLCRGNWDGRHMAEGGYEQIATSIFQNAPLINEYLLEYDDARSGGFEVLESVPADKYVALGLVSTKRNSVESDDDIKARISEASQFLPLDQLGICTQCGFAPVATSDIITPEVQRGKLELMTRVASEVWG
ncbi:MAG TPA: cobalamin-independent methionine synthase II family protein [Baekduia sp.]|nr:cobalamin-independent methionine synthase II family protein [Baekduia sp.]